MCAKCKVLQIWEIFHESLYPIICENKTPRIILNALQNGNLDEVLQKIRATCKKWMYLYVEMFGLTITPYVHIIGHHLTDMLMQEGNSVGMWSQVLTNYISDIFTLHLARV